MIRKISNILYKRNTDWDYEDTAASWSSVIPGQHTEINNNATTSTTRVSSGSQKRSSTSSTAAAPPHPTTTVSTISSQQEHNSRASSLSPHHKLSAHYASHGHSPSSSPLLGEVRKKSWQQKQQETMVEQQMRTQPIEVGQETWIEIDKDGKGLGLSIVGGSDTVLGTVVIHEVYPDGAAAADGRLKPGDQVLEVNNTSLRSISHEQAIALLRRTPVRVRLLVYRDVNLHASLLDPTQIYNILSVELVKKPGKGLGISIVGRKNEPGVYISEVVKGGAAEADGRLMQGDQILEVNSQDVTGSMQEDVAAVLKLCTGKVVLKVGRWKLTEAATRVHAAQPPPLHNNLPLQQQQNFIKSQTSSLASAGDSASLNGDTTASRRSAPPPPAPIPTSTTNTPTSTQQQQPIPPPLQIMVHDENQAIVRPDLSPVSEEDLKSVAETTASEDTQHSSMMIRSQQASHLQHLHKKAPPSQSHTVSHVEQLSPTTQARFAKAAEKAGSVVLRKELAEEGHDSLLVHLKKQDGCQWGMGIGKRPRGILITSLQPGSTAAEHLAVGDRIMAVNGEEVTDQLSAVTLVKLSSNFVALQISRAKGGAGRNSKNVPTPKESSSSTSGGAAVPAPAVGVAGAGGTAAAPAVVTTAPTDAGMK